MMTFLHLFFPISLTFVPSSYEPLKLAAFWRAPLRSGALMNLELAMKHGGCRQPMCDPEGCAIDLGVVGGGRTPSAPLG